MDRYNLASLAVTDDGIAMVAGDMVDSRALIVALMVFPWITPPALVRQCPRPRVQPYRGSDCDGPGINSTRLFCHLGCFKSPHTKCWRGRSLLRQRRTVSWEICKKGPTP